MEPKEIHDLIEILSQSNLSTLEIERDGFKLRLVKKPAVAASAPAVAAPVAEVAVVPAAAAPAEAAPAPAPVEDGLVDLPSPFVGTFYRSASPDADSFVDVGTRFKKGQVLCIVEAMKLMNEIEAETEGEIVEILAKNGQPVEFGEVLFRFRPA